MKTSQARATKEIEEEGFGGIVAMVGGENGGVIKLLTQLREVVVAQLPCGLFDALMVVGGMGEGVELRNMYGNIISVGKLADEGLVAVAVGGTKVKVTVGYSKRNSRRGHEVGEDNGVDAPANGKQHLLPSGEEVLLSDVCYECLKH